jgi:hypothetical protein
MSNKEFEYQAFQNKVQFVPREELGFLTVNQIKEYINELKCAIQVIEIDIEFRDETDGWIRQKAINALKSYKIALLWAQREVEGIK